MLNNSAAERKEWQHPKELLKLQKLRIKKHALQRRICGNSSSSNIPKSPQSITNFTEVFKAQKRKNPFRIEQTESKIQKTSKDFLNEDTDHTLFQLFNQNNDRGLLKKVNSRSTTDVTSFLNILSSQPVPVEEEEEPRPRTNKTTFCPIDWTLKRQIRLISSQPFQWSQKLKISEESSGITSFTRCLDMEKCETIQTLDVSPNAKFHQCCLYWQHPVLPWLDLFPRNKLKKIDSLVNLAQSIKQSLYEQWTDSLKSLFQLIRTRQCPYFYVCANTFTALFRAAGISGFSDLHVMVTPTTRGLRKLLKNEDIEFEMPLKKVTKTESENDGQQDYLLDENWLQDLGVDEASIKSINMTQGQILHQTECEIDSTMESLILIKGVEVNSFFNFLLNCKSIISPTGPLAGIPPTLFAPVAFFGATLNALKVKESKIHLDGVDFNSMELSGPILPSTVQNLFYINKNNLTMTFNDLESTKSFSRIKGDYLDKSESKNNIEVIFGKENLSDCGLNSQILNSFCSTEDNVKNIECVKITKENGLFSWS